jgi:EmrB/QacA subfamily drug resistance transporter
MPRETWTLVALILASGIAFLDGSVVNVALAKMDAELRLGLSGQQWVVDGYALTLSSFLILGGALGDRLGRKRVLIWGLLGFGVTSLLCGVASTGLLLVVSRLLQGAAAALLVPGALAIIRAVYTDDTARGRAIGTWSAFTSVSGVIGPLLGGLLVDSVGWRWVFLINLPLVALTVFLLNRFTPETTDGSSGRGLDWLGAVLIVLGLGGFSAGLIELPILGFSSVLVLIGLIGGAVCLAWFVVHQARTRDPMMPLSLFDSRIFSGINLVTLGVYFALGGAPFFLPIYAQNVMGLSGLEAGALMLPIPILLFLLSRPVGTYAARIGSRAFITTGAFVVALGLALFTLLRPDSSFWAAMPGSVAMGVGLCLLVAPLTSTVMSAVPQERSGVGAAVNNVASRVAGLLAVAGLGVVFSFAFDANLNARLETVRLTSDANIALERARAAPTARASEPVIGLVRDAQTSGLHAAMLFCAGMSALGGVIAWATLGGTHGKTRARKT